MVSIKTSNGVNPIGAPPGAKDPRVFLGLPIKSRTKIVSHNVIDNITGNHSLLVGVPIYGLNPRILKTRIAKNTPNKGPLRSLLVLTVSKSENLQ